jgi:hypothetical protein
VSSLFLKTHFTNFINLDVSMVTGFPEFPNKMEKNLTFGRSDPSGEWGPHATSKNVICNIKTQLLQHQKKSLKKCCHPLM